MIAELHLREHIHSAAAIRGPSRFSFASITLIWSVRGPPLFKRHVTPGLVFPFFSSPLARAPSKKKKEKKGGLNWAGTLTHILPLGGERERELCEAATRCNSARSRTACDQKNCSRSKKRTIWPGAFTSLWKTFSYFIHTAAKYRTPNMTFHWKKHIHRWLLRLLPDLWPHI